MKHKKIKQILLIEDRLAQNENIKRLCLRCSKAFFAPTKFIRVCMICKNNGVWQSGDDSYTIPGARYKKN